MPELTFQFASFPEECGVRPTFGLLDNARLLEPGGIEQVRVVGGAEVAKGSYPWQAQLEVAGKTSFDHSCGGIIISDNLILTAAHCHTQHESHYQIRVAQYDLWKAQDPSERILAVENIYAHSGYQPNLRRGRRDDMALFKLKFREKTSQHLQWDDYVQPLCLPTVNTTLHVGQECQISGWGLVDVNQPRSEAPKILRGAIVNILDPALCRKAYGNRFDEKVMVCAGRPEGGVDTCQGDSGGPLSCRDNTGQWFAAGVVSFGWGCGVAGSPGVYTRVAAFLEWIHRTAAFLNGDLSV